jgi:hypothetical protein
MDFRELNTSTVSVKKPEAEIARGKMHKESFSAEILSGVEIGGALISPSGRIREIIDVDVDKRADGGGALFLNRIGGDLDVIGLDRFAVNKNKFLAILTPEQMEEIRDSADGVVDNFTFTSEEDRKKKIRENEARKIRDGVMNFLSQKMPEVHKKLLEKEQTKQ